MIPSKLRQGQLFKQSVVSKINEIIQYLKTQQIVSDNRTIRVNQNTGGVSLSVIDLPSAPKGGSGGQGNYPFRLFVQHERNSAGSIISSSLHIQDGYIQMFSDHFQRCQVNQYNKDYDGVPLTDIQDVGTYYAILMLEYYPDNIQYQEEDDEQELTQNAFIPTVLFMEDTVQLSKIPQTQGLYSTVLGTIDVTYNYDKGQYKFAVSSHLRGDNMFNFTANHPFAITPTLPDIEDGYLIEDDFDLDDFQFRVNKGNVKFHGTYYPVQHQQLQMDSEADKRVYLSFDVNSATASAFTTSKVQKRYDLDKGCFNVHIANINYSASAGLQIEQFVKDDISLDQAMVEVAAFDQIPDYLWQKFKFNQPRWQMPAESGIFGSYILTSEISGAGSAKFTYGQLGLSLLWDNIAGFEPMKTQQQQEQPQYITHYYDEKLGAETVGWRTLSGGSGGSGNVDYKFRVSGSLQPFLDVQVSGKKNPTVFFKFGPEKSDPWSNEKLLLYKTQKGQLSAFHCDYEDVDQGVFLYDMKHQNFFVIEPEDSTPQVQYWSLVGNEDGIEWLPYASGTISGNYQFNVSGSLQHFLNVEQSASGGKTTITFGFQPQVGVDTWEDQEVVWYKTDDGKLDALTPPEAEQEVPNWFLGGNQEDGFKWLSGSAKTPQHNVSGSLEEFLSITTDENGICFEFAPQVDDPAPERETLMYKDVDGSFQYFTTEVQGTAGLFSYSDDHIEICQPPAATDQTPNWFLAGNAEDGLTWLSGTGGSGSSVCNLTVAESLESFLKITSAANNTMEFAFVPAVGEDPYPDADALIVKESNGDLNYKTDQDALYYFDGDGKLTALELDSNGIIYIDDGTPEIINLAGPGMLMVDEDGKPYVKSITDTGLVYSDGSDLTVIPIDISDEGLVYSDGSDLSIVPFDLADEGVLYSDGASINSTGNGTDGQILGSDGSTPEWFDTAECEQPQE